jgi:aryl-alcohol dehydrogenase-like predicted oxidoreductase
MRAVRLVQLADRLVPAVGCGEVCLATSALRGVDEREVGRALHDALARGVAVVEVAAEAGAERVCGDAVRGLRLADRVVVACRVPARLPLGPGPREPPATAPAAALLAHLPPAHVQACVEASLRASRLEVVPLALLALDPRWLAAPAWPELVAACARLVREGKVLSFGARLQASALAAAAPIAARSPPAVPAGLRPGSLVVTLEDAIAAVPPAVAAPAALHPVTALAGEPWLAAIAAPFHLCDRRAAALVGGAAGARRPALLARAPLAGGALAGRLGPGAPLAPADDRRALSARTLERIAVGCAELAPLVAREPAAARSCDAARAVLERGARPPAVEAATLAELALRYALDRGALVLPRLHRAGPAHLDEALAAGGARPLSAGLSARLEELAASWERAEVDA